MNNKVMFRKLLFIGLIFISIIVIIVAAYVTTYNVNKINENNIFSSDELPDSTYTKVSQEDFLNLFTKFELTVEEYVKPVESDNKKGKISLALSSELRDGVILSDGFNLKFRLGASWIKYKSDLSSNYNITPGTNKSGMKITTLDKYFKANGPLPFTSVNEPTLYVLFTWTNVIGENSYQNYTIITYEINDIATYNK